MDPATTPLQVNPTNISKFNTALQFLTLAVGIVHPALVSLVAAETTAALDPPMIDVLAVLAGPALPVLCWTTGLTTILSFASYALPNRSTFTEVVRTTTTTTTKPEAKH